MDNSSSPVVPSTCTAQKLVKMHEIVRILVGDPILLREWSMLSCEMGSKAEDRERWTRGINCGNLGHSVVFTEMMTSWVSRSSEEKRVSHLCQVLDKMECVLLVETLSTEYGDSIIENGISSETSEEEEKRPTSHDQITLPIYNFNGRKRELALLSKFLQKQGEFQNTPNLLLISGLGGIGKTELSKKFLHSIIGNEKRWGRIWLEGDTLHSLTKSIQSLSDQLGVKFNSKQLVRGFENVLVILLQKTPLVVTLLDNVDSLYSEAMEILKMHKKYDNLYIIVTSRDKFVLRSVGNRLELESLNKAESMAILRAGLVDVNVSDSEGYLLCELLENFPLAIQQAISYILIQREDCLSNYTVSDYVKEFQARKLEMLGHELNQIEHDYKLTTLVTWDMTFSKLSVDAKMVLRVVAYLNPDYIGIEFLRDTCLDIGLTLDAFKHALNTLNKYSLVKVTLSVTYPYCSIHRLVQEVARVKVGDLEFSKRLFDVVFLRVGCFNKDVRSVCKLAFGVDFYYTHSKAELLRKLTVLKRVDCGKTFIKKKGLHKIDLTGLDEEGCLIVLEKVAVFWACHEDMDKSEVNLNDLNSPGDWELVTTFDYPIDDIKQFLLLSEKHYTRSQVPYLIKLLMMHKSLQDFRLNACYSLLLEVSSPQLHHFHHLFYLYLLKQVDFYGKSLEITIPLAGLLAKLLPSPQLSDPTKNKIKLYLATLLEWMGWFPAAFALYREFEQSEGGSRSALLDKDMTLGEFTVLTPHQISTHFYHYNGKRNDDKDGEKVMQVEVCISGQMEPASSLESFLEMINGVMEFELAIIEDDDFYEKMENKIESDIKRLSMIREREYQPHYPTENQVREFLKNRLPNMSETYYELHRKLTFFQQNDWAKQHLDKQKQAKTLETSGDYKKALKLRTEIYKSCKEAFGGFDRVTKEKEKLVQVLQEKIALSNSTR